MNRAAERWIDELTTGFGGPLPPAVRTVVAQTRRAATGGPLASARVHTRAGRWLMVRGSLIDADRVGELVARLFLDHHLPHLVDDTQPTRTRGVRRRSR